MKRSLIIVLIFSILFLFCCTSCSCEKGCSETRGPGYLMLKGCVWAFGCVTVDPDNAGLESLKKHYIAVEGEDYSTPSLSYNVMPDYCEVDFFMEVYREFDLKMEICIVQDGVLLGTTGWSKTCYEDEDVEISTNVYYRNYNANGGEVYCFINKFEASRSV